MVIETNYFKVLKDRGVVATLSDLLDFSNYGATGPDEVEAKLTELERRYKRGDIEAANILIRQYKWAEDYTAQMGEALLSETDRELIAFHYAEIAMNLYLMGEEF